MTYNVVDLFAGAGGLSYGFLRDKQYVIKAFVENNSAARETYKRNHSVAKEYTNVIGLDYQKLISECGSIDVVIGGPPCQGFSNANRQHNELVNMNNQLVKEYVRAVCELQPKAFVMENVKMLKSDTHVFFYTKDDKKSGELESYHIKINDVTLDLLSEKYSSDELYEICFDPARRSAVKLSVSSYSVLNILRKFSQNPEKFKKTCLRYKAEIEVVAADLQSIKKVAPKTIESDYLNLAWELRSYMSSYNSENLIPQLQKVCAVQHLFKNVEELEQKKIVFDPLNNNGIKAKIKTYSVSDYIKGILSSKEYNYKIAEGVLNAAEFGAPQKRQRFILIGVKNENNIDVSLPQGTFTEENFRTVRDAIADLESVPTHTENTDKPEIIDSKKYEKGSLPDLLCDSGEIHNHIITNTRDVALARFAALKQGQNFHSLSDEMKTNTYTDVARTQNSIYQRLDYDKPSGTVLNVRKSMWIHPTINRALSIREAARLQTFPDSFVFCGTKDQQYQQIGNAVPPILGMAIANKVSEMLKKMR